MVALGAPCSARLVSDMAHPRHDLIPYGLGFTLEGPFTPRGDARLPCTGALVLYPCLHLMSPAERAVLFSELRARFCLDCGAEDPRCPCQRDE